MDFLYDLKVLLFVAASCAIYVDCSPLSDSDSELSDTYVSELDGQSLINLGRKLHKPILTILGMMLKKCCTSSCLEWTQWSHCSARRPRSFGTKSRQRKCWKHSGTPDSENGQALENDLDLCEGICPSNYNVTQGGFCFKHYETDERQDDAKKQCQQDGGNLVHIDSERKFQDVKTLLQGSTEEIFIDGKRKDVSSPWQFSYGSPERFLTWASGQPDDLSISLCLRLDAGKSRLLHDVNCEVKLQFLCEISGW